MLVVVLLLLFLLLKYVKVFDCVMLAGPLWLCLENWWGNYFEDAHCGLTKHILSPAVLHNSPQPFTSVVQVNKAACKNDWNTEVIGNPETPRRWLFV